MEPRLAGALKARDLRPATRAAAAEALLAINPEKNVPVVGEMLQDSSERVELQGRIIAAFRRIDSPAVTAQWVRALSAAPHAFKRVWRRIWFRGRTRPELCSTRSRAARLRVRSGAQRNPDSTEKLLPPDIRARVTGLLETWHRRRLHWKG